MTNIESHMRQILRNHRKRRLRPKREARFFAAAADKFQSLLDIFGRLEMKNNAVGACFDERLDIIVWIVDHEVDVEWQRGCAVDGGDRARA